jgi:hypothetical protein
LIIIAKEALAKAAMGTMEKLIPENMGIAAGILMLVGLEPEIHLWDHFIPLHNTDDGVK